MKSNIEIELGVVDADALKHRPGTVVEMKPEKGHRNHVKGGDGCPTERSDEVGVDLTVFPDLRGGRLCAPGEIGKVEDEKGEKYVPTPAHRPTRIVGLLVQAWALIFVGSRPMVDDR